MDEGLKARLERYVENGGHLLTTYFSGIADENDHIHLGGYPGALRDLLGVRVEELAPLLPGVEVSLSDGGTASLWADPIDIVDDGVQTLVSYGRGGPAVTRRAVGAGSASYLGAELDPSTLRRVIGLLAAAAGVEASGIPGVTRRVRADGDRRYLFLLNNTDQSQEAAATGVDLLTGREVPGQVSWDRSASQSSGVN